MNTARIKLDHQKDEVFANTWSDFAWAGEQHQALLERYGVCIVLIYDKQVVGTGKTVQEAVADAEIHLAPTSPPITPIIKFLAPRSRLYRLRDNKL